MKFIATNKNKVSDIAVTNGQIIFSRDERVIYLDAENERTAFQQIIILSTEAQRKSLVSPVEGFYFVEDTAILWNLRSGYWTPLNQKPDEQIIFDDMPVKGKAERLYVNDGVIYQWDTTLKTYVQVNQPQWQNIS